MPIAAEKMASRILAVANGHPLTEQLPSCESAELTSQSLAACVLMAGYATDQQAADTLSGRLWRALNGLPEPAAKPQAPVPASTDRATSTSGVPQSERVLNPTVLADKTTTFTSGAHMLQLMATLALDQIQRSIRGKIVRDFLFANHRFTIRVVANLQQATIHIYAAGSDTILLFRTLSMNELWAFAKARDRNGMDKIAKSMIENAHMRQIKSGHGHSEFYAEGIPDTDTDADGTPTAQEVSDGIRDDSDAGEDDADDLRPFARKIAKRRNDRT